MTPRNFGRDANRASRRAAADEVAAVEDERWTIPEGLSVDETVDRWLDDAETRVTVRVSRDLSTQRLVDYAVIHEIQVDGRGWVEIAKIDCAHGEVHKHWPPATESGRLQRVVIREIRSQADIEDTFGASADEIFDNLVINEGKWRDGR